jgi:ubiquinone/menaquinone biosynthesis C-methylase UbiE
VSRPNDQQYLKTDQYRDSSNLEARVVIHQRFSTNSYGWFRWVFDILLKLPPDARILELGCGHGLLWKENIGRIPAGWNITLSDHSSGMLDAAWRTLVVSGRAFKFEEIDAQSIPYPDATFDAVIANHMLYHVPDRPKAIGEIRRVLRSGGRLIATTVGEKHMREMMDWNRRVHVGKVWESVTNPFTLENGLGQLQPYFRQVDLSHYADNLQVTEVAPIMAYIRSGIRAAELSEGDLASLQHDLEKELQQKGTIFISKDSGLFEAIK